VKVLVPNGSDIVPEHIPYPDVAAGNDAFSVPEQFPEMLPAPLQ
jgi:hypothetical protein